MNCSSLYQALTLGIVNFLALENIRDAFELMKLFKKAKLPSSSSKVFLIFIVIKKNYSSTNSCVSYSRGK